MSTTYTPNYNLGKQTDHADKFDMTVITDNADKILEAVIGITNQPATPTEDSFDFGDLVFNEGCIDKIREIGEEAAKLQDGDDEGLNNILGDVCEDCNSAVYKLTRLS